MIEIDDEETKKFGYNMLKKCNDRKNNTTKYIKVQSGFQLI
jgi:hypothetical protein